MPNKRISRPELDSYIAAGVDVAVNFEDAADDYLGGYQRGKDKGQKAGTWMATELGWPSGGVCCSSIDADLGMTWGGLAAAYQRGFADGLISAGPYLPGIYGSSIALNGALADGTAHVFWLTAASYWSHGVPPKVVHLRQNGYWPYGNDADLNVTVLEPIGSYMHPLGMVDDMTPAEHDLLVKVESMLRTIVLDPAHPYSLQGIKGSVDTVEPSLAALKTQIAATQLDQVALQRVIIAAITDALSAGISVKTVQQAVTNALADATIPVVLTGHAGTPPVTP
jgi:hypothetical protein